MHLFYLQKLIGLIDERQIMSETVANYLNTNFKLKEEEKSDTHKYGAVSF